jgi:hypothetical protein
MESSFFILTILKGLVFFDSVCNEHIYMEWGEKSFMLLWLQHNFYAMQNIAQKIL